jgi:zinc protease
MPDPPVSDGPQYQISEYRVKRAFLSFLLLASLINFSFAQARTAGQPAAAVAAPTTTNKQSNYEVPFVNKTLANGLEVIVMPDPGVPLVTVELAVRNGSFTEPPELNGLSHLFEHMFFKPNQAILLAQCENARMRFGGVSDRCNEAFSLKSQIGDVGYLRNLGSMGITYNGSTREEVVNYYYTTTSQYFPTALRVINDSVRYPLFDRGDLEDEKKVVIGEIDRNESNPFYYLNTELMNKLFFKYPTRKNALGTRQSVSSATVDTMKLIQSRYYVPNNSALVVTGDVKPDEVFRQVEQVMGNWQRRQVDPFKEFPMVEHPPLPKSEGVIVTQPIENVFIEIGWHGPSIGKDDKATYAADVFSYIVGQPDSRLQRNLVDTGLATAVGVNYYTQRNVGPITILIVTTPDKAKAAVNAVYKEVAQWSTPNYFTDEELEASKATLQARDLFDREETSEYTHTLGFWWSSTGIDYFRGYQRNLNATTRADINRYITTYVQGKPHVGLALMSENSRNVSKLTEQDLIGN